MKKFLAQLFPPKRPKGNALETKGIWQTTVPTEFLKSHPSNDLYKMDLRKIKFV